MFQEFYRFKAIPFSRDTPTESLFFTPKLNEIVSRLHYAAQQRLFLVLTGDCGTGKTTLVRRFREELGAAHHEVLYISDSQLTPMNFYRILLEQMGCTSKYNRAIAKRQFQEQVGIKKEVYGIQPVCVCDECHLMTFEMLEEIRFMLNTHFDSVSPMGLILVGQNELRQKLKLQRYEAIRQRIDIRCVVEHYDRSETGEYIKSQIAHAQAESEIFTQAAVDMIHQYSAGTARVIDKLCTCLLLYGSQNQMKLIDDHAVDFVIKNEFS